MMIKIETANIAIHTRDGLDIEYQRFSARLRWRSSYGRPYFRWPGIYRSSHNGNKSIQYHWTLFGRRASIELNSYPRERWDKQKKFARDRLLMQRRSVPEFTVEWAISAEEDAEDVAFQVRQEAYQDEITRAAVANDWMLRYSEEVERLTKQPADRWDAKSAYAQFAECTPEECARSKLSNSVA